jgi:hypothetical protein
MAPQLPFLRYYLLDGVSAKETIVLRWLEQRGRPGCDMVVAKSGTGQESKSKNIVSTWCPISRGAVQLQSIQYCLMIQVHPTPTYFNIGYPKSNGPYDAQLPSLKKIAHRTDLIPSSTSRSRFPTCDLLPYPHVAPVPCLSRLLSTQ